MQRTYPLGFINQKNIPHDIIANSDRYLAWESRLCVSNTIAVLVAVVAGGLGTVARARHTLAILAMLAAAAAASFATAAACIATAYYSLAQNAFRHAGRFARTDVMATTFSWAAATLLLLATLSFVAHIIRLRASNRRPAFFAGGDESARSVDGGYGGTCSGGSGSSSGGGGVRYQLRPMRHHRSGEIPNQDSNRVEGGESIRAGVRY